MDEVLLDWPLVWFLLYLQNWQEHVIFQPVILKKSVQGYETVSYTHLDVYKRQCPNCGNKNQYMMSVARRTCGYIGTQFWNQGRTQEMCIRDRLDVSLVLITWYACGKNEIVVKMAAIVPIIFDSSFSTKLK